MNLEIPRRKKRRELREEIAELSKELGGRPPHEQMVFYSQGLDPCPHPQHLNALIKQCHDRREHGRPRAEDWERLKEYWDMHPEVHGGFVDDDKKFNAGAVLLPYMYPKLKSVEVSGELEHNVRVVPLTEGDIKRIEGRLKREF